MKLSLLCCAGCTLADIVRQQHVEGQSVEAMSWSLLRPGPGLSASS